MRRAYVNIGSTLEPRRIHFRFTGSGPPLIMLHASPMSSAALAPMMQALARQATVIAPDTPGYGQSDPLAVPGDDLLPYIDALDRFRAGLGIDRVGLYGTATGAQIAIEYAKTCQEHVAYLILDNAADFSDDERRGIVSGYFPEFAVEDSGAHLTRIWAVARDLLLFFPWYRREPGYRLAQGAINPIAAHAMARSYLEAGPDYARAYRAAFDNEEKERLLGVGVPSTILRWAGSILKRYTDRLDETPWPDHFHMAHCGPTMEDRIRTLETAVAAHLSAAELDPVQADRLGDSGDTLGFIDTALGQIHLYQAGAGRPLLLLHDLGESGQALTVPCDTLSAARRVLLPDLPGHGHSMPANQNRYVDRSVAALEQMLDVLSIDRCDVIAWGRAAAIGCRLGARVSRLVLINPIDGLSLARQSDLRRETADLTPVADGSHLLRIWAMLYQRQLFHPWYQTDPKHGLPGQPAVDGSSLNQRLLERLWAAESLAAALASVAETDLDQAAAGLDEAPVWCLIADDPMAAVAQQTSGPRPWQTLAREAGGWLQETGLG